MPGNIWLIGVLLYFTLDMSACRAGFREGEDTCVGMISAAATMSKTIANKARRGGGMPGGAGGLGIGTVIILGLIGWALGIDPSVLINGAQILSGGGSTTQQTARRRSPTDADRCDRQDFVAVGARRHRGPLDGNLHRDGQDLPSAEAAAVRRRDPTAAAAWRSRRWGRSIARSDQQRLSRYLVLQDMQNKFGACSSSKACRFSEAYVIAHEVGHHVQDELGILPRVTQAQQAASGQTQVNALQVRIELQADCFAGVWANRAQQKHNFLDAGDVDQALQTASAIGDDRLQKEAQGYVVPDGFTHGTSEQRKRWFSNGFRFRARFPACDTLSRAQDAVTSPILAARFPRIRRDPVMLRVAAPGGDRAG